jgi:hypothetical protein
MTAAAWAGPSESEPGAVVVLPNGHLARVQPHNHHPTRAWAPVQDLTTGIHSSQMVTDLRLATDRERSHL